MNGGALGPSSGQTGVARPLAASEWSVEWKPAPTADDRERMGRAMQLLLDAARGAAGRPRGPPAEASGVTSPGVIELGTKKGADDG